MLRNQPRIFKTQFARSSGQFRSFEKLCRCSLTTRAEFVCYLACATFFLKKLFTRFASTSFCFATARGIAEDRVDDLRTTNQSLLIDRDQFEERAVWSRRS